MIGLLVEDEPLAVRAVQRLVRLEGVEVIHVERVALARPLVARAAFVISDWHLPDGTGAEIVQLAREFGVPVIVSTSSSEIASESAGVEMIAKSNVRRLRDFVREVRGNHEDVHDHRRDTGRYRVS